MATTPPAEGIASEMSKIESPIIDVVPFHLVSFKDRKTTKLLKNAIDHQSVKSQNKFFDFAFHKPLLITKCKILTQDFLDGSTFEYKWIGVDGKLVEGSASAKDNIVFIFVNGIARSISFKPPRAYFTKPLISNVEIFGFEVEKSDEFLNFAETVGVLRDNYIKKINNESEIIAKSKAELVALQAQRGSLTQDISSLKNDISREQGKLKRTEVQKNEILVQIGNLQRDLGADGSRLNELKIDTEVLTGRKTDLNIEVSTKKAELSELH